ncbi:putative ALG11 mannosyltransferase [Helianthus anomalus]
MGNLLCSILLSGLPFCLCVSALIGMGESTCLLHYPTIMETMYMLLGIQLIHRG